MAIIKKKIEPDPRIWRILGRANYTMADALSELCANSFDAKIIDIEKSKDQNHPLIIDIQIDKDQISIIDNGCGMTVDILGNAMKLGVDMDLVTGNTTARKGMYGLGMKIACASLGNSWKVSTRPVGLTEENSVETNLDEWSSGRLQGWEIDIESDEQKKNGPLTDRTNGTAIVITRLNERNPQLSIPSVIDRLQRAYIGPMTSGDIIRLNGEAIVPKEHEFRENSRIDINVKVGDYLITGVVGLDRKYHNDGEYGMNLYRQQQLVELWNKQFFTPHTTTSIIRGDLNLDFVPANVTKSGFEKSTTEWKDAMSAMKEALLPLVAAARGMQGSKKNPNQEASVLAGLADAVKKIPSNENAPGTPPALSMNSTHQSTTSTTEAQAKTNIHDAKPSARSSVELTVRKITVECFEVQIATSIKTIADPEVPWSYIYNDKKSELVAYVNNNSTIYRNTKDSQLLGALAVSEAIFQFLTKHKSFTNDKAFVVRNRYLSLLATNEDMSEANE